MADGAGMSCNELGMGGVDGVGEMSMRTPGCARGYPQPQVVDRMPADVAYQPGDPDEGGLNRRVHERGSPARRMPSQLARVLDYLLRVPAAPAAAGREACATIGSSVSSSRSALSGPAMLAVMAKRRRRRPPGRPPGRWDEAWQLTAAPGSPFPLPRSEPGA
jgi:hypothetical protein